MSPTLWYDSDEVKDFHPHVEGVLWDTIDALGLRNELEVIHHPSIVGATTTPDFAILLKSRSKFIFILEVKRTRADVGSERFWVQTEGYVSALDHEWLPGGSRYFGITNLEEAIFFAERDQYVGRNILKNGRFRTEDFIRNDIAHLKKIKTQAIEVFKEWILKAYRQEAPEFAETWPLIIESFNSTYEYIHPTNITDPIRRDASLYELLRVLFFEYLKSSYSLNNHPNASAFRALDHEIKDPGAFLINILTKFGRVLEIDFKQIFQENPQLGLFKNGMTNDLMEAFEKFIKSLEANIDKAYKENPAPEIFFKLLTNKIYQYQELHAEGKVMSDPQLANLLAELTITNKDGHIIDPGSGDGALLDATYDKLEVMHRLAGNAKSHSELLKQLHGYEADSFLNQLAAFRLLAKNLKAVDNLTEIDLVNGDVFMSARPSEFDFVLMNPPFLRNDDPKNPIPEARKKIMLDAIKSVNNGKTLLDDTTQPNLYFYFMDWIGHYLKEGGRAGVILMAKFLGNKDGEHLKRKFKDEIETIVVYPNNYFKGFRITTCIVILKKGSSQSYVNFLNIRNVSLLEDPKRINAILDGQTTVGADFSLVKVERNDLNPEKNWRSYLLDPAGDCAKIQEIDILKEIEGGLFSIVKRGEADNSGESTTIFLKSTSQFASFLPKIENEFIGHGLQNNREQRKIMLDARDLEVEQGIHFPGDFESLDVDDKFLKTELGRLFIKAKEVHGSAKWRRIVNSAYRSNVNVDLLLPRASRTKYSVHMSELNSKVLLSTNFCYATGLLRHKFGHNESLKAIVAYLMSSFGQMQFELEGANQEGMLKIELFMVKVAKSIDPDMLNAEELNALVVAIEKFNNLGTVIKGDEGISTPRRDLDLVVASILIKYIPGLFKDAEGLANFAENLLADIVSDRSNQNG